MPRLIHKVGRGLLRAVPPLRSSRRLFTILSRNFRAPAEEIEVALDNGKRMIIDMADYVSFHIYMYGYYEAQTVSEVKRRLMPGMTFFDIGGHFGQYTLVGSAAVGDTGAVHTFEPGPAQSAMLRRNIELNECTNVVLNRMALGAEQGTIGFKMGPDNNIGTSHIAFEESDIEVEMTTFDDYCAEKGIRHIDVMKIDVEGAELLVFQGAKRVLSESPPSTIFYEAIAGQTAPFGYEPAELHQFLTEHGYTVSVLDKGVIRPVSPEDRGNYFDFVAVR